MNIVVYGTLRKGGKLSFLMPKGKMKVMELEGFEMYDMGFAPAAKKGRGKITVEFWNFSMNFVKEWLFLRLLDLLESTYLHKYERERINTNEGDAWMYIYRRSVKGRKRIYDWQKCL